MFGNPSVDLFLVSPFTLSSFPFPLEALGRLGLSQVSKRSGLGFANLRVS
jgi:hypothetical protein